MPIDTAKRRTLDIKDPPLKAIVATNDNYDKGYHEGNVGGLDAVDADLATANIKSGVVIFGKVGSANVLDVSDADAAVTDVKSPRTFYSVTGPKKTGTMPTQTLNPANENVPAGYYAATTLSTVDGDLAAANIKSGITIFGFTGLATVQDISAADAAVTDVKAPRTFFSVTGGIKTGTLATVALDPALNAYPAGYHAGAASLTAVDADLATGNIKSGITIFGVAGAATVQDISAANATVAQVLAANTFFSVTGAIKTGTMPTVTLADASNAYPTGYHAGAANLAAIDAHLAVGNIKTGVNIFGYVGTYDTSGSPIAATRMRTGDEGWVNGAKITGTGTKTLNAANETVAEGYYAATTLSAVDADLAVGNIKSGVTIFGFLGTFWNTLSQDLVSSVGAYSVDTSGTYYQRTFAIAATSELELVYQTKTFATNSMAVGGGFALANASAGSALKLRLYMGGIQVAESAYLATAASDLVILVATKALSGSQNVSLRVYNYSGGSVNFISAGNLANGGYAPVGIIIGSIKMT